MQLDLFAITPTQIQGLKSETTDPVLLSSLSKLETAVTTGDEFLRIEAIGELSDVLVLERGVGL